MDPDAALANLRELVYATLDGADGDTMPTLLEICELVDDLDGWLTNGKGYPPADWQQCSRVGLPDNLYAVTATYTRETPDPDVWGDYRNGQVGAFLLNADALGIMDEEQATRRALDILSSGDDAADKVTYSVCAVKL